MTLTIDEVPRERFVFDSRAQLNMSTAIVPLSGDLIVPDSADLANDARVEVRVFSAEDGEVVTDWTDAGTVTDGTWSTDVEVERSTDWLRAEARIVGSDAQVAQQVMEWASGHVWAMWA